MIVAFTTTIFLLRSPGYSSIIIFYVGMCHSRAGYLLSIGDRRILRLPGLILRLTFGTEYMTYFYSDVEPFSKYSPVMLHLSLATRILKKTPARGYGF